LERSQKHAEYAEFLAYSRFALAAAAVDL